MCFALRSPLSTECTIFPTLFRHRPLPSRCLRGSLAPSATLDSLDLGADSSSAAIRCWHCVKLKRVSPGTTPARSFLTRFGDRLAALCVLWRSCFKDSIPVGQLREGANEAHIALPSLDIEEGVQHLDKILLPRPYRSTVDQRQHAVDQCIHVSRMQFVDIAPPESPLWRRVRQTGSHAPSISYLFLRARRASAIENHDAKAASTEPRLRALPRSN